MEHQLDFWPAGQKLPYEQGLWESLSFTEQVETTARLAQMIAKAVCPQLIKETEEDSHD